MRRAEKAAARVAVDDALPNLRQMAALARADELVLPVAHPTSSAQRFARYCYELGHRGLVGGGSPNRESPYLSSICRHHNQRSPWAAVSRVRSRCYLYWRRRLERMQAPSGRTGGGSALQSKRREADRGQCLLRRISTLARGLSSYPNWRIARYRLMEMLGKPGGPSADIRGPFADTR